MDLISKAIDLLKAGAWQLVGLALAAATFLLLDRHEVIQGVTDTWRLGAWAVALGSGFLALAPAMSALENTAKNLLGERHKRNRATKAQRAAEQRFRDYIPYLSDRERAILGYLLNRKQKTFTADTDAGYGASLMALGFIVRIGVAGQTYDIDKMPMAVPDHVWKVMEEDPGKFEYEPEYFEGRGPKVELQPWRIPWNER